MIDTSWQISAMNCHYRFFSLESFFADAQAAGYKAVEIWCGPMHFALDYARHDDARVLTDLAERYGVTIIGICPEQTNPKPANVAARGEEARARTLATFKNVIDVARETRANKIVITSGWGFLDEPREDAWARSVSMLREIVAYAADSGVTPAIEALQCDETNLVRSSEELERLLDDVADDRLAVCLDLGAAWRAGDSIPEYFKRFGTRIKHLHFSDIGSVSHLAWGDGARDMASDLAALARAGYAGPVSFEIVNSRYHTDPAAALSQSARQYRAALDMLKEVYQ
ncbi:MAG TPA: sugar phosphate isomerase/epimerase [Candidatus Limicola stercorigallinarum]|nr:sugar phosphate isomerase/epimerase [Candidatus Limicola stercorigallinarum]